MSNKINDRIARAGIYKDLKALHKHLYGAFRTMQKFDREFMGRDTVRIANQMIAKFFIAYTYESERASAMRDVVMNFGVLQTYLMIMIDDGMIHDFGIKQELCEIMSRLDDGISAYASSCIPEWRNARKTGKEQHGDD